MGSGHRPARAAGRCGRPAGTRRRGPDLALGVRTRAAGGLPPAPAARPGRAGPRAADTQGPGGTQGGPPRRRRGRAARPPVARDRRGAPSPRPPLRFGSGPAAAGALPHSAAPPPPPCGGRSDARRRRPHPPARRPPPPAPPVTGARDRPRTPPGARVRPELAAPG